MWGLLFSLLFVSRPDTVVPVAALDTVPPEVELRTVSVSPDLIHGECVFDSCFVPFMVVGRYLRDVDEYLKSGGAWSSVKSVNTSGSTGYQERAPFANGPFIKALRNAEQMREVYRAIHSDPSYDEAAEKEKFVQQLEAFRDTASALPVIYGDIQTKYGGDVRAYVDDLFARSALTNHKRMKRLSRSPSLRKLQRDAGFQFAVAKLFYLSWELRGRPQDEAYKSFVPNYWRISEE